jgi:hypothetical protein
MHMGARSGAGRADRDVVVFFSGGMLAKKKFCMICSMRPLVTASFAKGHRAYSPKIITNNIKSTA